MGGSLRQERRRIESVERLGRDAARVGHSENLLCKRGVQTAVLRHRDRVGNRFVRECRSEEHGAVRFLAPEIAPDVRRDDCALVKIEPAISNGGYPRRDAAVDLSDDHRAAAAVMNHAGLLVIIAEVNNRTYHSLVAYDDANIQLYDSITTLRHVHILTHATYLQN